MLNYHGCRRKAIKLIPHNLIDILHITVKPSHLEKLQIIQNINKLMFQVIIFSDWILIKQIIVSSTYFFFGEAFSRKFNWSFEWGTEAEKKMHRFNAFSRNVRTIYWKIFPTHGGICKIEKIQQAFLERDKTLSSLKEYERVYH